MKKQTLLGFLCVALIGCGNTKELVSFTPGMTSFSNEFDFDPLRRLVKDSSQTLLSDKGKVTRHVAGTLPQEGCFDILELYNIGNNTGIALVPGANYYRDAETLEKWIRLQGKCQLAELPAAGTVQDTDGNGFAVSTTGKKVKVQYRYNAEGYPPGKTIVSRDNTLQADAKPSIDPLKKLDCTTVNLLNNCPSDSVKQTCKYDEYADPVNCQLVIVDKSMKPTVKHHYSIRNTIDYY